MAVNTVLRNRISMTVTDGLKALPQVLAGWEGGSAAFGQVDAYSDIDLTFLVIDDASLESLYATAENALVQISPIELSHPFPIGKYYKLRDCNEFLLLDLVFLRAGDPDHFLEPGRHGQILPLFDKAQWLVPDPANLKLMAGKRVKRYRELRIWFLLSQTFVRKAMWRDRQVEAIAAFWSYTIRPLVELLRMQHCPVRWDFGMRYLERDVPPAVYDRLLPLLLVQNYRDLELKLVAAADWATELFSQLDATYGLNDEQ